MKKVIKQLVALALASEPDENDVGRPPLQFNLGFAGRAQAGTKNLAPP